MFKDIAVCLLGPQFWDPTHRIFVDLGLTAEKINAIHDAWAARPQSSNWDEGALREFIGLETSNPHAAPQPRDLLQERLDRKEAEKRAARQAKAQRPAWHSMFIAPCLLFLLLSIPGQAIAAPSEMATYNVAIYYDQNQNETHDASDPGVGGQEIEMVVWPCNPNDPACTTPQQRTLGHTDANGNVSFQAESTSHLIAFCYDNIYRFPVVGCRHPVEPLEYGVSTIFNLYMPVVKSE